VKKCRNCFQEKEDFNFSKEGKRNHLRPYCKACRTVIETRRLMEKKLQESPTKYWECENCFRIISKRTVICRCGEKQYFVKITSEDIHVKA
jgi:hypothetical protein